MFAFLNFSDHWVKYLPIVKLSHLIIFWENGKRFPFPHVNVIEIDTQVACFVASENRITLGV